MKDLIERQAAIDHWRLIIDATNTDSRYNMGFVDGLEFCISHLSTMPSAQPEQRWIPCSERLPEESGRYLISALDGIGRRTTVAPYQPRYKAWTMTGRMAYWKVVAWQPLPEPYREDGEAK